MHGTASRLALLISSAFIAGCASTTVTMNPEPSLPLCQETGQKLSALVLWTAQWRPDQKDVPLREAAAEHGISRFFARPDCFARTDVRRVPLEPGTQQASVRRLLAGAGDKPDRVLVLVVRELGPVVKLLASASVVEGGTEVVLDITDYASHPAQAQGPVHSYSLHWQNGGPGVINGVASLPADMEAALAAGLKPMARQAR
jgi:hypothetical protein